MSVKRTIKKTLKKICLKDLPVYINFLIKILFNLFENIDSVEKLAENINPKNKEFCSKLNSEDIAMLIIDMQREYVNNLIIEIWEAIMILEINILKYVNWIHLIFYQHLN